MFSATPQSASAVAARVSALEPCVCRCLSRVARISCNLGFVHLPQRICQARLSSLLNFLHSNNLSADASGVNLPQPCVGLVHLPQCMFSACSTQDSKARLFPVICTQIMCMLMPQHGGMNLLQPCLGLHLRRRMLKATSQCTTVKRVCLPCSAICNWTVYVQTPQRFASDCDLRVAACPCRKVCRAW